MLPCPTSATDALDFRAALPAVRDLSPGFPCCPSRGPRSKPCMPVRRAGATLRDDAGFWSSAGSHAAAADEALLYRLAHPLTALHSVTIGVCRARYQFGCACTLRM